MTDGGSMKGSGIYSKTLTFDVYCKDSDCGIELPNQDVNVDDFGVMRFKCPKCGNESEFEPEEVGSSEPDRMTGDGE